MSSPYLTVQEVAELARCEHRTVRRAIRAGELKASLIGGRWIVKNTSVEEWFEAYANQRQAREVGVAGSRGPRYPKPRSADDNRPGSVADLEAIRERIVGT